MTFLYDSRNLAHGMLCKNGAKGGKLWESYNLTGSSKWLYLFRLFKYLDLFNVMIHEKKKKKPQSRYPFYQIYENSTKIWYSAWSGVGGASALNVALLLSNYIEKS